MTHRTAALLALLPLTAATLPLAPALAEQTVLKPVVGAITDVTVYPDRAQVTRTARVDLSPGTYKIRFDDLPIDLEADSIRVRGNGTADALIGGFDVQDAYLGHSPSARVAQLELRLQGLQDQVRANSDARDVANRQLALVRQAVAEAGTAMTKELAIGKARVDQWKAMLDLLEHQQATQLTAIRNLDLKHRALSLRMVPIQLELNKLRGFQPKHVHRVPVTVTVRRGGWLDLSLDYVLEGARWAPAYDARYAAGGGQLDWRYFGQVAQQTGENWNDVHLKLSTAEPAIGSTPPSVPSWFLSLVPPEPPRPMAEMAAPAPMSKMLRKAPANAGAGGERDEEASKPAQELQAVVRDQGSSVTLEIPGLVTVPSDGEPHQATIGEAHFPADPHYKVVAQVSPAAYLEVEAKHTGPWPLLPGPVRAFVGQDYVGTTPLPAELVPGQKFGLPLGVDRSIVVKHERTLKNTGVAGLFTKRSFAEYRYRLELTSYKATPQKVTVLEGYPQTTEDDIAIRVVDTSPEPSHPQPGQLKWELTLQPQDKREIKWGYHVDWPAGQQITGLE